MIKLNIIEKSEPISENTTIINSLKNRIPYSWEKVFNSCEHELKDVSDLLEKDSELHPVVYPLRKDVFRVFHLCAIHKIRVVIIGQDPYHGLYNSNTNKDNNIRDKPQATGMAFSVPKDCPVPSSLRNIYKELSNTVSDFKIPNHGDLTRWVVEEGIFLLNTCLTVRASEPDSHKEIWLGFIKKIVKAIVSVNPDVIFVLWGKKAESVQKFIGNNVTVLTAAHPSGLSCNRGFFGCDHFNKINLLLKEKSDKSGNPFIPINWNL